MQSALAVVEAVVHQLPMLAVVGLVVILLDGLTQLQQWLTQLVLVELAAHWAEVHQVAIQFLEWFWQVAGRVVQELPLQLMELWVEQVAVLEQQPLLLVGLVTQAHLLLLQTHLVMVAVVERLLLQQVTLALLAYLVVAGVALTVLLVLKLAVRVVEV